MRQIYLIGSPTITTRKIINKISINYDIVQAPNVQAAYSMTDPLICIITPINCGPSDCPMYYRRLLTGQNVIIDMENQTLITIHAIRMLPNIEIYLSKWEAENARQAILASI